MKKSELKALIREVIEETFPQQQYNQAEADVLMQLGFHWIEKDKEWYNDSKKYKMYVYKEGNEIVLRTDYYDEDGQYQEDYEHFKSIEELKNYLT